MRNPVVRLQADRLAETAFRLRVPALLVIGCAEVVVRLGKRVVDAQGATVRGNCAVELAVVDQRVCEVVVITRYATIERSRLGERLYCVAIHCKILSGEAELMPGRGALWVRVDCALRFV